MILSFGIQEQLKRKSGLDFSTPADIDRLALDIESKTGERLGTNTLKRLLGVIEDERDPRQSTLQVIALYLGYDNWQTMLEMDGCENSDFDESPEELRSCDLTPGTMVEFEYLPN